MAGNGVVELFVPLARFEERPVAGHIHAVDVGRFIAPNFKVLLERQAAALLEDIGDGARLRQVAGQGWFGPAGVPNADAAIVHRRVADQHIGVR